VSVLVELGFAFVALIAARIVCASGTGTAFQSSDDVSSILASFVYSACSLLFFPSSWRCKLSLKRRNCDSSEDFQAPHSNLEEFYQLVPKPRSLFDCFLIFRYIQAPPARGMFVSMPRDPPREVELISGRPHVTKGNNVWLLRFKEIADRDAVETLRNYKCALRHLQASLRSRDWLFVHVHHSAQHRLAIHPKVVAYGRMKRIGRCSKPLVCLCVCVDSTVCIVSAPRQMQ
jgi:hypothetical protein